MARGKSLLGNVFRFQFCLVSSCLFGITFGAIGETPQWPTLGGSMQRTGLSPNAGPTIGCVKWFFDTATPPASYPNPIYAPAGLTSSVALGADGTIYFTSENGNLYALNPEGLPLWTYSFQSQIKQRWSWPLNDGNGTTPDANSGPFDGELVNFTDPNCWIEDDPFGFALQFDGIDDLMTIPGFKGIGGSVPRRVSAWVKTTATTVSPIVHWGNAASTEGVWRLQLNAEGKPTVITQGSAVADIAVNTGEWMHVEAVLPPGGFQAADIVILVNGQKVPTTVTAGSPNWIDTDNLCDMVIGSDPVGGTYFSGSIAYVEIEE
jgi:hypothetical protein